jgi:hypothetical protein
MNNTYRLTLTDADGIVVSWFFVRAGGEGDPFQNSYDLSNAGGGRSGHGGEALIAEIRAAASQADFSRAQEVAK